MLITSVNRLKTFFIKSTDWRFSVVVWIPTFDPEKMRPFCNMHSELIEPFVPSR